MFTNRCEVYSAPFGGIPRLIWKLPNHDGTRFNDVFDAGNGIYFCGVAPIRPDSRGELWRLDAATGVFTSVESVTMGMPNGMGLSPDRKTFYFVVSDERVLYAYDFDSESRTVGSRHRLVDDFMAPGVPDGMCVDPVDGSLLVAFWDGYRLERRAPNGKLLATYRFPIAKVTSVEAAEGRVWVTTGNLPRVEEAFRLSGAGGVFEVRS